ncbi:uncharacterized protein LOC106468561 [Limulus polyphemus]|uniref:Uncharacterized protein LOC106468561 n=1 Tax=Limulus polyphemus TaxID=6850 RepID=A0ABM1BLK3_LIMPO|nr:uncharacterized protein LOC106468561 [Limulus polyphemus]
MKPYTDFVILTGFIFCLVRGTPNQESYVSYGNGATSERNLPVCENPNRACNVLHKRFWLSPLAIRLCKCPDRSECPTAWSEGDDQTVHVNRRAQLKFCGKVGEQDNCTENSLALVTERVRDSAQIISHNVEVHCHCPKEHYYDRLNFNVTLAPQERRIERQYYRCIPLERCGRWDFCGHITTVRYETYHVCTCPVNHICIMVNRQTIHAMEPLFDGLAYRGLCTPYNS